MSEFVNGEYNYDNALFDPLYESARIAPERGANISGPSILSTYKSWSLNLLIFNERRGSRMGIA